MITVANGTNTYNGLSTDTKPLLARNGDLFTEIDTGTNYMFDAESGNWTEVDLGGGGVTPTGEIEIVQNGTYDVSNYAEAVVDVPASGLDSDYKKVVERSTEANLSVTLPSGLKRIGTYAFYSFTSMKNVEIPNTVTEIADYAFNSCSKLAITKLPTDLEIIGYASFSNCDALSITELPDGLKTIGTLAFSNCSNITITSIPSGVTDIPDLSFRGCKKISSITLPSGITNIGSSAFQNCSLLTEIICYAVTPPTLNSSALSGVPANCAIYVPAESVDAYKAAANWSARADYIQAIQA